MSIHELIAGQNTLRLNRNLYPGRGIVIGTSLDGKHAVQIYWIMGRSENSRNRIFSSRGGRLFTEAADPSKVKNPKLIIYNAMDELGGHFIVSNGDQTDTVMDVFSKQLMAEKRASLSEALSTRQYEPDEPNFTPRITGLCRVGCGIYFSEISILRKSELTVPYSCERFFYEYGQLAPGFGFCITTYTGDGDPLPSFKGEPYILQIGSDIEGVAAQYWQTLNPDNRVSLAVKFIDIASGMSAIYIINKYEKVSPKV